MRIAEQKQEDSIISKNQPRSHETLKAENKEINEINQNERSGKREMKDSKTNILKNSLELANLEESKNIKKGSS